MSDKEDNEINSEKYYKQKCEKYRNKQKKIREKLNECLNNYSIIAILR